MCYECPIFPSCVLLKERSALDCEPHSLTLPQEEAISSLYFYQVYSIPLVDPEYVGYFFCSSSERGTVESKVWGTTLLLVKTLIVATEKTIEGEYFRTLNLLLPAVGK